MKVSVLVNTYNRASSLARTLDALRWQTFADFEVVVVNGPSTDGTDALLAERADAVRVTRCPEPHLAKSRNLGVDAAAGDVVAFIDDDAVPEPRWLETIVAAYGDAGIGGAGGLVFDHTGVRLQYRYSVCDRMGNTDFDRQPPFEALTAPGADPFVYLQGTNATFRRDAVEAVNGFDEEIEYDYDEAELCVRLIDAGWRLRPLDGAAVHHKFLASHLRRGQGLITDPYFSVKNRVYFALRHGRELHGLDNVFASLTAHTEELRERAREHRRAGRLDDTEYTAFADRLSAGFDAGVDRGLHSDGRTRRIADRDPEAFRPYPVLKAAGPRIAVAFISRDYPPKPPAGIARLTHDLARGMAADGHDIHVVTRDDEHDYRLDFEEGVWVHRFPVGSRWVPAFPAHPLRPHLDHLAAVHGAVRRLRERFPLDVVSGSLWTAEPLLPAFDPRSRTVLTCPTPMRVVAATQPAIAARDDTRWQVALEDAALSRVRDVQALSHANLETVRGVPGAAVDGAEVIWPGVEDRRDEFPREAASGDDVEILFVGRLEPRKGVDTLLDAAIPLLAERPSLRVRLAGVDSGWATGGPRYRDVLAERLADRPELLERFVFEGEVRDDLLYRLYADADVFCAPSLYESFGLVNVEAMMMGLPVVSCRAGGVSEVVVDGETGLLVEPGDADGLRGALERLVDDAALRRRMGDAGRARYEREFRSEIAARRTADYYTALARDGAPQPDAPPALAAAAVRDGLRELLVELTGLSVDVAGRAADQLLAPEAFPVDYIPGVRAALVEPTDEGFIRRLYATVFGREPEELGLLGNVELLESGTMRIDIVRRVATSAEAKAIGVDASFLERPELAEGVVVTPGDVAEILGELDRLTGSPPAFVHEAYLRLLGRAPEPGDANRYEHRLATTELTYAEVIRELVASAEAGRRLDPAWFAALDDLAPGLATGAPASWRGVRAARKAAKGALRALDRRPASTANVEELRSLAERDHGLTARIDVLQTKLEAMAMDLRERVPVHPAGDELPEPVIVDPGAYARKLAAMDGALRVNLGCGEKPVDGYINVDFRDLPGVDVVADVRNLPFEPGSLAELMSAHLVEHFRQHQLATVVLPYWRTLLAPGGVLRTICPNWEVMLEQLQNGELSFADFKTVTFGLQDYSGDDHFAMYSPATLMAVLREAGFDDFEIVAERRQHGMSPELEVVAGLARVQVGAAPRGAR
jgi:glycogen(starch) synthase